MRLDETLIGSQRQNRSKHPLNLRELFEEKTGMKIDQPTSHGSAAAKCNILVNLCF